MEEEWGGGTFPMDPLLCAPKTRFLDSAGLGSWAYLERPPSNDHKKQLSLSKKHHTSCLKTNKLVEKRDSLFFSLILLPFSSGFHPKHCERPRPLHSSSEAENPAISRRVSTKKRNHIKKVWKTEVLPKNQQTQVPLGPLSQQNKKHQCWQKKIGGTQPLMCLSYASQAFQKL